MAWVEEFSCNVGMEEELDFTKLKYVLYARKSTDDPSRQLRSIEDQIIECAEYARRNNLHIVNTLTETKSAKKPGQRPIFSQMIKDLRKGLYDGVLAWNPDRLARNMREGGEIIDMIDEEEIKDLKFVTHHFTKDANGKMLLGLAFVLSKQYSDKLSQDVRRGVSREFSEGKSPTPKHGYVRNDDGLQVPDGHMFKLICKAWEMRAKGSSYIEITKFLNDKNYAKETKGGKKIRMHKQILTGIFKDPFYYGILLQKQQSVDLRTVYNFVPATTEEVYNKIQNLSHRKIMPNKKPTSAFYPLKNMVICYYCGSNMYIGPSTSKGKTRYLYARCDNKLCSRKRKSIRMIKIFEFIYEYFEKNLNFTKSEYARYYGSLKELSDKKRDELNIDVHSKSGSLKVVNREIKERSLKIIELNQDSEVRRINEQHIDDLVLQKEMLENEIENLRAKITKPEQDALTLEQFLNISRNAAAIVKSANERVKDEICRLVFLNTIVDEEKVTSYQAKEPFASLLKHRELSCSQGSGT